MRIGIIGPSKNEIMPFIEKLSDKKVSSFAMLDFYRGSYNSIDVVALYSGVCKVNASIATQILIDKFNVTHIIVVGVAGAIDRRLNIGDTVISTELAYHDVDDGILTEYHPWMKNIYFNADSYLINLCRKIQESKLVNQKTYFGRIVTGEAFISDYGREHIINRHNPLCVDMESASIAHVCYVNNIPFLAIRTISDTENESGTEVFEKNCVSASINSINILEKILEVI
ncbi:5'-methylthioadenosine/adenosylhomocysteine nucleosidase [Clostridium sp. CTA-19]